MSVLKKLADLKTEAVAEAQPHVDIIREALNLIDESRAEIEALGLSCDISWPYGRGEVAKAVNTRISVGASIKII